MDAREEQDRLALRRGSMEQQRGELLIGGDAVCHPGVQRRAGGRRAGEVGEHPRTAAGVSRPVAPDLAHGRTVAGGRRDDPVESGRSGANMGAGYGPARRSRGPRPRPTHDRPRRPGGAPGRSRSDHALLRLRPDRRQPAPRQPDRADRAAPVPGGGALRRRSRRRRDRDDRRPERTVGGAQPPRRRDARPQRRRDQGADRPHRRPRATSGARWSTTGTGPGR